MACEWYAKNKTLKYAYIQAYLYAHNYADILVFLYMYRYILDHYLLFMKDIIDTITSILVITFVVVINHFYDAHNY